MFELQLIVFLVGHARRCLAEMREAPDRGDVAEKVVLIGIFVALAIVVGAVIAKAVQGNAAHLSHQINAAP